MRCIKIVIFSEIKKNQFKRGDHYDTVVGYQKSVIFRHLVVDLAVLKTTVHQLAALLWEYRERKCADTTGTLLVPWAGHFQC